MKVLGAGMPLRALLAGSLINGVTHFVIDQRRPLYVVLNSRIMRALTGDTSYLHNATVLRRDGTFDEHGPGTHYNQSDQAAHLLIGVLAAVVMAVLSGRRTRS